MIAAKRAVWRDGGKTSTMSIHRASGTAIALTFVASCASAFPAPTVPAPVAPASSAITLPHPPMKRSVLPYPDSKKHDVVETIFGTDVHDPYRWLEDATNPDVRAWMHAEDDLARAELAKLPERDAIAKRLHELFYVDVLGVPRRYGQRVFYARRHATAEKSIVCCREGNDEKVLLDPNAWTKDGNESLGVWQPSWDGKHVAFSVKPNNRDDATLYVLDVATGKRSPIDVIEGAREAFPSWTPRGDGFYYTWLPTDPKIPEEERPGYAEIRFHELGKDPRTDRVVRPKLGDPTRSQQVWLSRDGHFLVLSIQRGWSSTDVYFRDMRQKNDAWTTLVEGRDANYGVDVFHDQFFVQTDDGAPNGRVFVVDPKKPGRDAWREIVPERKDAALVAAYVLGGLLSLSYLKNATSHLEVRDLEGKLVREVALPGIGKVDGPYGRSDDDEAYYAFESFTQPTEIFATSMKTGKTSLYSKVDVPVDPSPFVVEQVFYPSKDGTRVSMFVVRRKDAPKDGKQRVLLYGYGGFQIAETPAFSASMYAWLERGGIYAVANLRGGSEYGEDWHRHGMLLEKQNTFDDFIAAAEFLVNEGWTSPEHLAISGGSNGGLLVGAAMTQRPDLFAAVLCAVPLLDMVRYHRFGAGKTWIAEYGSADDEAQFRALYAYSPYHHVKDGVKYPATLLLSADTDDRVDPMHARKFAAALQDASTGGPVLLRIERNAGHGGADLRRAEVEKGADRYAFALYFTK